MMGAHDCMSQNQQVCFGCIRHHWEDALAHFLTGSLECSLCTSSCSLSNLSAWLRVHTRVHQLNACPQVHSQVNSALCMYLNELHLRHPPPHRPCCHSFTYRHCHTSGIWLPCGSGLTTPLQFQSPTSTAYIQLRLLSSSRCMAGPLIRSSCRRAFCFACFKFSHFKPSPSLYPSGCRCFESYRSRLRFSRSGYVCYPKVPTFQIFDCSWYNKVSCISLFLCESIFVFFDQMQIAIFEDTPKAGVMTLSSKLRIFLCWIII